MGFFDDIRRLQRQAGQLPAPGHVAKATELMGKVTRLADEREASGDPSVGSDVRCPAPKPSSDS